MYRIYIIYEDAEIVLSKIQIQILVVLRERRLFSFRFCSVHKKKTWICTNMRVSLITVYLVNYTHNLENERTADRGRVSSTCVLHVSRVDQTDKRQLSSYKSPSPFLLSPVGYIFHPDFSLQDYLANIDFNHLHQSNGLRVNSGSRVGEVKKGSS